MIRVVEIATVVFACWYVYLAWRSRKGFIRLHADEMRESDERPAITVLIAARNEEGAIGRCLDSILALDYPAEKIAYIVINDHSTDSTLSVIAAHDISQRESFVLLESGDDANGKQQAIRLGLKHALTDVILCTDADCVVPPSWAQFMVAVLDKRTAFVAGPVLFEYDASIYQRVQALEFLGLVAIGAGSIADGLPTICNSANLCYRKSVVLEIIERMSAVADLPGFDESLLQVIHRTTDWNVAFSPGIGASVATLPTSTIVSFMKQRIRWASTGGNMPDGRALFISASVIVFYLLLVASASAAALAGASPLVFLSSIVAKMCADALIVIPAVRLYGRGDLLPVFPLAEIVHIPYILFSVVFGLTLSKKW